MKEEQCRSCGAAITWVKSSRKGKWMPLNVKKVDEGVRFTIGHNRGVPTAYQEKTGEGHESHFATCPDAPAHRKPKDTEQGELL